MIEEGKLYEDIGEARDYGILDTNDLNNILDKAKKEFPKMYDKKYQVDRDFNYSSFNSDLLTWFKKWFGELNEF